MRSFQLQNHEYSHVYYSFSKPCSQNTVSENWLSLIKDVLEIPFAIPKSSSTHNLDILVMFVSDGNSEAPPLRSLILLYMHHLSLNYLDFYFAFNHKNIAKSKINFSYIALTYSSSKLVKTEKLGGSGPSNPEPSISLSKEHILILLEILTCTNITKWKYSQLLEVFPTLKVRQFPNKAVTGYPTVLMPKGKAKNSTLHMWKNTRKSHLRCIFKCTHSSINFVRLFSSTGHSPVKLLALRLLQQSKFIEFRIKSSSHLICSSKNTQ